MNQQSHGQHKAAHPHTGQTASPASSGKPASTEGPKPTGSRLTAKKNETVLGPFTIRDLTVFGSTLILFVGSLIPMFASRFNLWNLGSLFFLGLGILLPLIVTALFVARRLTPGSKLRIGSLSIDQFASVVASFALAFFFLAGAETYAPAVLVALIGSLGLFASTVLARFIPFFAGDFLDRTEAPAHVVARESAVPFRKPSAPKEPKPAKEPGSGTLAGWGKRLTSGSAAGGAAAAGGTSLNGDRPHAGAAGASAGTATQGASQYGATQYGATQQGAAQPANAHQATGQQSWVQPASTPESATPQGDATPAASAAGAGNAAPARRGSGRRCRDWRRCRIRRRRKPRNRRFARNPGGRRRAVTGRTDAGCRRRTSRRGRDQGGGSSRRSIRPRDCQRSRYGRSAGSLGAGPDHGAPAGDVAGTYRRHRGSVQPPRGA